MANRKNSKAKTAEKSEAFSIDKAEAKTRADLANAIEARTQLLANLAAGADVNDELNEIDDEIVDYNRKIAHYAEARAAIAASNSVQARQARHDQVAADLQAGLDAAAEVGEQAQEVIVAVASLGGALELLQEKRDAASALFHSAYFNARHGAAREHIADDLRANLRRAMGHLTLPGSIADAVWKSGLGRRGVNLTAYLDVRPSSLKSDDPTEAIRASLAKLEKFAATLSAWSVKCNIGEQQDAAA